MKKKRRTGTRPAVIILIGTVAGLLCFAACLLAFSWWMTKNEAPEIMPLIFLLLSAFFGATLSAFLCKKRLRQQGMIPILISFASFTVPVLLLILFGNLFSVSINVLSLIPTAFAGAVLGGLAAAKLR